MISHNTGAPWPRCHTLAPFWEWVRKRRKEGEEEEEGGNEPNKYIFPLPHACRSPCRPTSHSAAAVLLKCNKAPKAIYPAWKTKPQHTTRTQRKGNHQNHGDAALFRNRLIKARHRFWVLHLNTFASVACCYKLQAVYNRDIGVWELHCKWWCLHTVWLRPLPDGLHVRLHACSTTSQYANV